VVGPPKVAVGVTLAIAVGATLAIGVGALETYGFFTCFKPVKPDVKSYY
jgi:hypothetical protein